MEHDVDNGNPLFGSIVNNINLLIQEKAKKIQDVKHHYPEWWLAFEDWIGFGVSEKRLREINSQNTTFLDFDRILLVSPFDIKNYHYLLKE